MKKNKLIFGLLGILILIAFVAGGSYAYFNPIVIGNDTASTQVMKSGSIEITYSGTNAINVSDFEPGESAEYIFTVKNTGLVAQSSYEISFGEVVNRYLYDEVVYTLACVADFGVCSGKTQAAVPKLPGLIMNGSSIDPGVTHTYTLTVSFIDTESDQEYNINKTLSFYIYINQTESYPLIVIEWDQEIWTYKSTATQITFDITADPPAGTISNQGNLDGNGAGAGKIKWYRVGNHIYIHSETLMVLPANCTQFFYDFPNLTTIDNLNYLLTYNVTNMNGMFSYCDSLTAVDISEWDFTNVTNTSYLFYECFAIKTIRLDNASFDNVSSRTYMFIDIPSNPANKGNIYVKDQEAADWIYARLVESEDGDNIHLNNNIIIV